MAFAIHCSSQWSIQFTVGHEASPSTATLSLQKQEGHYHFPLGQSQQILTLFSLAFITAKLAPASKRCLCAKFVSSRGRPTLYRFSFAWNLHHSFRTWGCDVTAGYWISRRESGSLLSNGKFSLRDKSVAHRRRCAAKIHFGSVSTSRSPNDNQTEIKHQF